MVFTEIRIGTDLIATFYDLVIEQSFNAHHNFSFYIPNNVSDNGIFFIKEGGLNYIGKEITIKWGKDKGQLSNTFNGLITGVRAVTQEKNKTALHLRGYSSSYAFANLPRTRSFFDKDPKNLKQTLEDVVHEAVKDAKAEHYCKVSCKIKNNLKIPYVVQYRENTFDFLNRLAIKYGEWFYVEKTTLYFGNAHQSKAHELLLGSELLDLDYEWNAHHVRSKVNAYNHQLGEEFKEVSSEKGLGTVLDHLNKTQKNIFGSGQNSEYLRWQPHSSDEVKKQADYQYEQQLVENLILKGESDQLDIRLGDILKLKIRNPSNNTEESLNECRIITITHFMKQADTEEYHNVWAAVDKNADYLPVAPAHRPPPYQAQPEYAKVHSTKDSHGRVQVVFFWNNQQVELNKSFYMPCLSSYAGGEKAPTNRGIIFIPEVGDTVLIGYCQNDPNQPYVMGGLHNTKTAQIKEEHQEKNDIKSILTTSGHLIEFNDKNGAESITIIDKDKNKIRMDKEGIGIQANDNKNNIKMSKEGIIITDLNNNTVKMSSSGIDLTASKTITLNANSIKIEGKESIDQKGGASEIKIEATGIEQKGGPSEIKIGAAGVDIKTTMANIKASMVNIS